MQDLSALSHLESALRHETQLILLHLLRVMLEQQVADDNLPGERAQDMLSNYEQAMEDADKASVEKQVEEVEQVSKLAVSIVCDYFGGNVNMQATECV